MSQTETKTDATDEATKEKLRLFEMLPEAEQKRILGHALKSVDPKELLNSAWQTFMTACDDRRDKDAAVAIENLVQVWHACSADHSDPRKRLDRKLEQREEDRKKGDEEFLDFVRELMARLDWQTGSDGRPSMIQARMALVRQLFVYWSWMAGCDRMRGEACEVFNVLIRQFDHCDDYERKAFHKAAREGLASPGLADRTLIEVLTRETVPNELRETIAVTSMRNCGPDGILQMLKVQESWGMLGLQYFSARAIELFRHLSDGVRQQVEDLDRLRRLSEGLFTRCLHGVPGEIDFGKLCDVEFEIMSDDAVKFTFTMRQSGTVPSVLTECFDMCKEHMSRKIRELQRHPLITVTFAHDGVCSTSTWSARNWP